MSRVGMWSEVKAMGHVETAEKRVLARARAWYRLTSREIPARSLLDERALVRKQIEQRQRVSRAMERLIFALGLDEAARNNLAGVRRKLRRAR